MAKQESPWDGVAGGQKKPKLTAEMFKGRRTVLTVASARIVTFKGSDEEDGERKLFVTFEECPEHELNCNKGEAAAFKNLCEAGKLDGTFDTESNTFPKWVGKRVPLEKYETKYDGKTYEKLRACHPDDFDDFIAAYDKAAAKK